MEKPSIKNYKRYLRLEYIFRISEYLLKIDLVLNNFRKDIFQICKIYFLKYKK